MFFFKKVRDALGLDRCHFPMTGAAPTNEDTLTYFMSVNIPLHELYGMSETTGKSFYLIKFDSKPSFSVSKSVEALPQKRCCKVFQYLLQ